MATNKTNEKTDAKSQTKPEEKGDPKPEKKANAKGSGDAAVSFRSHHQQLRVKIGKRRYVEFNRGRVSVADPADVKALRETRGYGIDFHETE